MTELSTLQRRRRELLLNSGFASAVSLVVKLRGVVLLPIVTRSAGVAEYGVWVQITALLSLIPPLFGLNLHQALTRFSLKENADTAGAIYRRFVGVVLGASGIGALAIAGAALAVQTSRPTASTMLFHCACLLPPVAVSKLGIAYIRGRGQVKRASLLEALLSLIAVGTAALAFAQGYGIQGAIWALVAAFSAVAIGTASPRFTHSSPLRTAEKPFIWNDVWKYALPAIPAALADWILFALDRYALGVMVDNTTVGIYGAAYSLAQLIRLFGAPVVYALMPAIGKLWDQDRKDDARQLTAEAAGMTLLASLLVGALLVRNGPWLLEQLSTRQIANGSAGLLPLLISGLITWMITRVFFQLFIAQKRTFEMTRVLVVSALVNVLGNATLIPTLGAKGAALATLFAYLFALIYTLFRLRRILVLRLSLAQFGGGIGSVGVLGLATTFVPHASTWLGVLSEGIAFSFIFAAQLVLTRVVHPSAWRKPQI